MKFIPILFSTAMVQANHDGRKNQTRRLNGLEGINAAAIYNRIGYGIEIAKGVGKLQAIFLDPIDYKIEVSCPYGNVGDMLWVRETFTQDLLGDYYYRADKRTDTEPKNEDIAWRPSIHMPAAACRSWCIITGIECQRLQDITEEDAIREGIEEVLSDMPITYRNYEKGFEWDGLGDATQSYQSLWKSINGKDSWDANPWVWVVRYEHTTTPPTGWEEYLQSLNNRRK